jgi:hypothetical protein
MRRAYETLCPYERTYERENINAVLRLVQESEIQAFIRTIARAKADHHLDHQGIKKLYYELFYHAKTQAILGYLTRAYEIVSLPAPEIARWPELGLH